MPEVVNPHIYRISPPLYHLQCLAGPLAQHLARLLLAEDIPGDIHERGAVDLGIVPRVTPPIVSGEEVFDFRVRKLVPVKIHQVCLPPGRIDPPGDHSLVEFLRQLVALNHEAEGQRARVQGGEVSELDPVELHGGPHFIRQALAALVGRRHNTPQPDADIVQETPGLLHLGQVKVAFGPAPGPKQIQRRSVHGLTGFRSTGEGIKHKCLTGINQIGGAIPYGRPRRTP